MISPQTSVKLVWGHGTSVDQGLAMAFDDPTMDDDLRTALAAHEIVLARNGRMSGSPDTNRSLIVVRPAST